MGSAMNCFADRYVSKVSWTAVRRSYCPYCGHTLAPRDMIPVLSYIFLRGRCRYCKRKIRPRYFVCECLLGICFAAVYATHISLDGPAVICDMLSQWVLVCCLLPLSLIDIDSYIIPNRFIIIPAAARAVYVWFFGLHSGFPECDGFLDLYGKTDTVHALWGGCKSLFFCLLTGLCVGGALLLLSLVMDRVLGRESMGGGDIKLFACVSMFFSPCGIMLVLLMSCIIGITLSIFMQKEMPEDMDGIPVDGSAGDETAEKGENTDTDTGECDEIPPEAFPFGPSIAAAAFLGLIFAERLAELYIDKFF